MERWYYSLGSFSVQASYWLGYIIQHRSFYRLAPFSCFRQVSLAPPPQSQGASNVPCIFAPWTPHSLKLSRLSLSSIFTDFFFPNRCVPSFIQDPQWSKKKKKKNAFSTLVSFFQLQYNDIIKYLCTSIRVWFVTYDYVHFLTFHLTVLLNFLTPKVFYNLL